METYLSMLSFVGIGFSLGVGGMLGVRWFLGESNDPDNPDYQERRKASQRFVGKILSRVS